MSDESLSPTPKPEAWSGRGRALALVVLLAAIAGAGALLPKARPDSEGKTNVQQSSEAKAKAGVFYPTAAQWAALTIEPIQEVQFRSEVLTDGKIAVDENRSTPIFSPYSGRVTKIAAEHGEVVQAGQLLFALEATDMVQAQNDFIAAVAGLETARSQQHLAEIVEKRQHDLYEGKAVPLKDWQQAQADLITAQDNTRTAEISLEAVRNRLRILQKTEAEIATFERTGKINPDTPIYAPISGTVVQRKIGPGQYITSGASDPTGDSAFVIGDLSTVWLIANVRESDALKIRPGQPIQFNVLASAVHAFTGKLNYVAASMDANTRRLLVRATIENPAKLLKPEMFARVTIFTGEEKASPAVPREAIVYEGDAARIWVAADDKSIELRRVELGLTNGNLVQVVNGVKTGEKVVTKGTLFIDRAATGNET
jgi:cobalt-zinc-cadmium efflux system membrane fusion protein